MVFSPSSSFENIEPSRASHSVNDGLDQARNAAYGPGASDGCKMHKDSDLERLEILGIETPGAFEHVFRKNLPDWDKDKDGWVSKEEMDAVQFDSDNASDLDVVVWHALRENLQDIQSLSNDEYGLENDGITVKDVLALQELKQSHKRGPDGDVVFNVKMSAFDADRQLQPVEAEISRADAGAGRSAAEKIPTSYSSITRKGNAHYVYHETENPNHPGVSYPSQLPRIVSESIMMGWPKEIHEYLTKEKGGRYTGEEADLSGIDLEKLKKQSKDGVAFHKIDPGTVMDVINNDGSLARYYNQNKNWTVEQRAEARSYSQQADFQRMFKEHLALWDKNKNGALSSAEVLEHIDDKFQSRESAIMLAAMTDAGPRIQSLANDLPIPKASGDYEVTARDVARLSRTFDDVVQSLRNKEQPGENEEWKELRGTLSYLNTQISRAELATGAPKPGSTYRDLWRIASQKYDLRQSR